MDIWIKFKNVSLMPDSDAELELAPTNQCVIGSYLKFSIPT
jgi:hypothetical protein